MPKKLKNVWDEFVSFDNLLNAAHEAARGKSKVRHVAEHMLDIDSHILDIQERLNNGAWYPGEYRAFYVFEPKRRLIHAPSFDDRIVHHALVHVIGPRITSSFISDTYACLVGRGTHAASTRLWRMLNSAHDTMLRVYVLKADISKYFYSIDHDILKEMIARQIGDKRILELCFRLIDYSPSGAVGLPLGCLTSQLWANLYLSKLDHFIKDFLRIRHYVRYMDDFVILHESKAFLWELLDRIRDFTTQELKLTLNRKTGIYRADQGVDFAGYRHWHTHILPRKRNLRAARRRVSWINRVYAIGWVEIEFAKSCISSLIGYVRHCKGFRSLMRIIDELSLTRPFGVGCPDYQGRGIRDYAIEM